MSSAYDAHLSFQLGENGHFTEQFYYDPDEENQKLFGIFVDGNFDSNRDSGHVFQKSEERKILMSSKPDFDIYSDKKIKRVKTGKEYIIRMTDDDDSGFYILYL